MKRLLAALPIALLLTLFTPSLAHAEDGCVINVLGIKVCGTLLGQPLPPVVTVTVRPDPIRLPGATVTLPAPPRATVEVPGPTVKVPGPTKTVTVNPAPVGPSELPQPTKTVTETTAGQTTTSRVTVTPSPEVNTEVRTEHETQTKTETIVKKVFLGTLVSLVLALLGLIAMLVGYYFGRKDEERKEKRFLGNILDYARTGKRPDTK